jgi:AcrR family transcriptional regulator
MGISERKAREKERRRNEIIDAAERLFFSKGFEHVTMDEIAAGAELSKGTLYLYFRSREDLHYAIVIRGLEILNRLIREAYDARRKGLENILEMGEAYIRFFREHIDYFRAIISFDATKFEKVDDASKLQILGDDSPLVFFMEVLREGQADGSINGEIPAEQLAIILWAQVSGVFEFIALRGKLLEMLQIDNIELIRNQIKVLLYGLECKKKE